MPRGAGGLKKLGKARKRVLPRASRKGGALLTFRFNPQEGTCAVLSRGVCGMLLPQPQEMVQPISHRSRLRPREEKGLPKPTASGTARPLTHCLVLLACPPSSLGDRAEPPPADTRCRLCVV